MNIQTGIAIGLLVFLALAGLGVLLQLIGVGRSRKQRPVDVSKLLDRFLPRQ